MLEQNSDGHVVGPPRDAFWKSGAGGFALIIVPSLDLVIYKMGGNGQYDPTLADVPQPTLRSLAKAAKVAKAQTQLPLQLLRNLRRLRETFSPAIIRVTIGSRSSARRS